MKIIVMYPDRMGKHSLGDFGENLLNFTKNFPEITFQPTPIINGGEVTELRSIYEKVRKIGFDGATTYESEGGLSSILYRGYDWIEFCEQNPDTIIVRMDTNEHPVSKIIEIATLAQNELCLSIFERELNEKNASPEEILANNQTFPCLYKAMTNGKVCLSNTHGFQAMSVGTLKKIWPHVRNLIPLNNSWGMDAVMALSASVVGVKIIQKSYYLEEKRQRGVEKIEEQLRSHVELLMNARRFFV